MTGVPEPRGTLALALQEVLTAVVRIRANRQSVADARIFRSHIREALKQVVRDARDWEYSNDQIQFAMLAVVGFLDESILNSQIPGLADWPRETLTHELFKHHLAGEKFFENLEVLLGMQDSTGLADVLEVYRLCLLLGFRGKYVAAHTAEIKSLADTAGVKIARIRGRRDVLFPDDRVALPPPPASAPDRLRRPLIATACGSVVLAIALFVFYYARLDSALSTLVSQVRG